MGTVEDAKLLKKMIKKEQTILIREERIFNGTATAYDIKMHRKAKKADATRRAEKALERAASKRRRDEDKGMQDYCHDYNYGGYEDDFVPAQAERVERVFNKSFNPKKERKQFWAERDDDFLQAFITSYNKGEPDFRLEKPLEVEKPSCCSCLSRNTATLTGYMFGGPCKFSVSYCSHQPLLETLVLSQMLPTSTEQPRSAVHFSIFEYGNIAKLDGSVSNHGFVKIYNSWCLHRGGFKKDGAEHRFVAMDGNFSWKRRHHRNKNKLAVEEGIFAPFAEVKTLIAPAEEVERFRDETEVKDEECMLQDLDSDFKAGNDNRRQIGNRFDECGVFSLNCARHGIVERVFDIFGGEGRKYALAAVNHVVDRLATDEKLGVMYDIVCQCQKRLEESIPLVLGHDTIYGVTIFHALAHSVNCQVKYFPRYVTNMGLTDGESVERVWSHANHFVGMSRGMTKANRHALLAEVLGKYRDDKTDVLAAFIQKKYAKVIREMRALNITISEYLFLENEWAQHADNLCIRPNTAGLDQLQTNAERQEALQNPKIYYLILIAQYLTLKNKETKSNFTGYHVEQMRKTLLVEIELMERSYSYGPSDRPKHFKDPLFHQYHVEVKQCRYDALDSYLNHLLFAIVMREAKLHQPAGSSGTAKAARIVISLETLYKITDKVIICINALVMKYFGGNEQKKRLTVGREVEKLRRSAQGENILGLSDALTKWHLLNRHVEETHFYKPALNRALNKTWSFDSATTIEKNKELNKQGLD
ncbi:hypothetical protein PS6_007444 [Mucor atramentarius]